MKNTTNSLLAAVTLLAAVAPLAAQEGEPETVLERARVLLEERWDKDGAKKLVDGLLASAGLAAPLRQRALQLQLRIQGKGQAGKAPGSEVREAISRELDAIAAGKESVETLEWFGRPAVPQIAERIRRTYLDVELTQTLVNVLFRLGGPDVVSFLDEVRTSGKPLLVRSVAAGFIFVESWKTSAERKAFLEALWRWLDVSDGAVLAEVFVVLSRLCDTEELLALGQRVTDEGSTETLIDRLASLPVRVLADPTPLVALCERHAREWNAIKISSMAWLVAQRGGVRELVRVIEQHDASLSHDKTVTIAKCGATPAEFLAASRQVKEWTKSRVRTVDFLFWSLARVWKARTWKLLHAAPRPAFLSDPRRLRDWIANRQPRERKELLGWIAALVRSPGRKGDERTSLLEAAAMHLAQIPGAEAEKLLLTIGELEPAVVRGVARKRLGSKFAIPPAHLVRWAKVVRAAKLRTWEPRRAMGYLVQRFFAAAQGGDAPDGDLDELFRIATREDGFEFHGYAIEVLFLRSKETGRPHYPKGWSLEKRLGLLRRVLRDHDQVWFPDLFAMHRYEASPDWDDYVPRDEAREVARVIFEHRDRLQSVRHRLPWDQLPWAEAKRGLVATILETRKREWEQHDDAVLGVLFRLAPDDSAMLRELAEAGIDLAAMIDSTLHLVDRKGFYASLRILEAKGQLDVAGGVLNMVFPRLDEQALPFLEKWIRSENSSTRKLARELYEVLQLESTGREQQERAKALNALAAKAVQATKPAARIAAVRGLLVAADPRGWLIVAEWAEGTDTVLAAEAQRLLAERAAKR